MKSKIYILLVFIFSSFNPVFASCYDKLVWDIKKYGTAADIEITNFANERIIIKKFNFFDDNSKLVLSADANWLINKKSTINKRIIDAPFDKIKSARLECYFASTQLSNTSDNHNKSNKIESDPTLYLIIFCLFIVAAGVVLSRKTKRNNSNKDTSIKDTSSLKKKSPFYKKIFLLTLIAPVVANVAYSLQGGKGISSITFPLLIGGLAWTLIAYFASKATKASSNKIKKEISKTMDTKPDTSKSLKEVVHDKFQDNKQKKEKQVLKEDEIYDQIGKEIEEDKKIRSVWTKALAQADGDVNKAESQYIKIRFDQLNK